MGMRGGGETTHQLAISVVDALKEVGLAASPKNFELWHAYKSGRNPVIGRFIEKAIRNNQKISQMQADELYREHILRGNFSNKVLDIISRVNEEVTALTDVLEESSASATDTTESLNDLSEQLHQSATDYPAVGALLESAIKIAQDMFEQNKSLESKLEESSNEISTLRECVERIEEEAMKDALTGAANRAAFDADIEKFILEARANETALSLLIADIDHFKKFNDSWGHQTGDQVLRLVAEVTKSCTRKDDTVARYGGEEFAVLLPTAKLENARMLAERIRTSVATKRLKRRTSEEDLGAITMSLGAAQLRKDDTSESLIERADKCLYAAKDAGRNQVIDESQLDANGKLINQPERAAGAA